MGMVLIMRVCLFVLKLENRHSQCKIGQVSIQVSSTWLAAGLRFPYTILRDAVVACIEICLL
jgi:hypothetical protein